jgi:hypothetical protein
MTMMIPAFDLESGKNIGRMVGISETMVGSLLLFWDTRYDFSWPVAGK